MADQTDTKKARTTLSASQWTCIELFKGLGHEKAVSGELEVTINFHPDRLTSSGIPLLHAIAKDGVLKSQFETGTSNGGLSAFPGGGRWAWESRAFKGSYDSCEPSARPKYGALNYKKLGSGGSPRFGSSYFKLKPELLERTTFCYPESFFGPRSYGAGSRVGHLIEMADADETDLLDNYIEAHIHGVIAIHEDIQRWSWTRVTSTLKSRNWPGSYLLKRCGIRDSGCRPKQWPGTLTIVDMRLSESVRKSPSMIG